MNKSKQMTCKLAIIDSGLGGYGYLLDLMDKVTDRGLVFVADQAFLPYGNKPVDLLIDRANQLVVGLVQKYQVNSVFLACNTLSSVALPSLRKNFPDLTICGVSDLLLEEVDNNLTKTLILATPVTVNSGFFQNQLKKLGLDPYPVALAKLAKEIEENNVNVQSLQDQVVGDYDQALLACTHYPIIQDLLKTFLRVPLCDGKRAMVTYYKDQVFDNQPVRVVTTLDGLAFKAKIQSLFDKDQEVEEWIL